MNTYFYPSPNFLPVSPREGDPPKREAAGRDERQVGYREAA